MTATMKLKTLQGHLQDLKGFVEPKIQYEQYQTPAHIAAVALYTIQTQYEDIENQLILDAGCGPGSLGIGAALLGAGAVTALDIDSDALAILQDNISDMEITNIDALQCDFLSENTCRFHGQFDTVLMNPPFGTKNNLGIDMKFLRMGTQISCNTVYSLHKSSTRSHIEKKVKDWGMKGSVIAELRFELPSTYRFHRKNCMTIAVDLWRLEHQHL